MHRSIIHSLVAAATLAVAASDAQGQEAGSGAKTVRVRVFTAGRDSSTRARRERLLLRFDSLRYEFEKKRVGDPDRDRVADEMHRTVMELQESLDDATVRSRAMAVARESGRETMIPPPDIEIAMQGMFAPRGYLGVSFDGPSLEEWRAGGEHLVRFLDYPRIAMVEPSSPAERAGIQEGDTLLALNANDVRERQISLSKLLVPGQRIVVRARREGSEKRFLVTISEAPGYVMSRRMPMPPMPPAATMVRAFPGEELPLRMPTTPIAAGAPVAPTPPIPMAGSVWIINEGVAGAKLESVSEGLGKALGTKSGILVLRAAPGTPAYASGLRDGDVIVRADGQPVTSVRQLRSALVDADGQGGVKLAIIRERKQREVVLRW